MPKKTAFECVPLNSGWRMVKSVANAAATPSEIDWSESTNAVVPGTVASGLPEDLHTPGRDAGTYDDSDWWYQCEFQIDRGYNKFFELQFDGLATISDVWLNGKLLFRSRNMFRARDVDVTDSIQADNTLSIAFRSISNDLESKRPRPRWKTNLIANQQLRWIRTTLLGRIPGWTPPLPAVGPWLPIRLSVAEPFVVKHAFVYGRSDAGRLSVSIEIAITQIDLVGPVTSASISLKGRLYQLPLLADGNSLKIDATIDVEDIAEWNPHGYGDQALHEYSVNVETATDEFEIRDGKIGFRSAIVDRNRNRLALVVNNYEIFARGGCWTSNDIVSLVGKPEKLRALLILAKNAGVNVIRVGGTMVYETDLFYSLCDELGIAVWQDFMFANMDYPAEKEFVADVSQEIKYQVRRLREHPCVIVFCGNSEVEQQAAMFGIDGDIRQSPLFYQLIPDLLDKLYKDAVYFPSSPCEGDLPFHNNSGPSHYFGVGAYKQSYSDLEKSNVKFATECLAFSNIPAEQSLREHFASTTPVVHHPKWKSGVPRDSASGWDFEDVRDHYLAELFDIDPVKLRYSDKERYIALSQVSSGEVAEIVFNAWRHSDSDCSGGIVWFMNDIVPGAGWGFIDSDGRPKPLYYFLKRCWSDRRLWIRDLGMDGLSSVVDNDTDRRLEVGLRAQLIQHSNTVVGQVDTELSLQPRETLELSIDAQLGRFFDIAHRYRFGPPKHDVVVMTLIGANNQQLEASCYFPNGHNIRMLDRADIKIEHDADTAETRIQSNVFLQRVRLSSKTHEFSDNYFHLAPGLEKTVATHKISSLNKSKPLRGTLSALNLTTPVTFR